MGLDPNSRARFNLTETAILLLDATPLGMSILAQILGGLGARNLYRCPTVAEAKEVVLNFEMDLIIVDSIAETGEGYEFVQWLRREVPIPNKHVPTLITTGHTMISDVAKARNCGGNYIVTKPIAPIVILERIIWIAKEGRAFLVADDYVGPDRRSSDTGRPRNLPGRRREDRLREAAALAAQAGAAETDGSVDELQRKAAS